MKALSIVGFVLGIVALVLAWFPLVSLFALPMAIVGLILSAVGGKKLAAAGQPKGLATAGLVIGIIATVLTGITFFTCGICALCAADAASDIAGAFDF